MTSTTVIRPVDPTLREAWRLAALFAAIKLMLHVATNLWQAHLGYGYFRDEMYYILCGRNLAWGYVDHGPGVAVQARISLGVFGRSLTGIRLLAACAGAARVFLTGLICWVFGGRRPAQGLAMIAVLAAPMYLGLDSYLSMNSFESLFWMVCILALALQVRAEVIGGHPKLWLVWGLSAGLGLLNKPSMTFFLVALLVGLLLSRQRGLLFNRWAAAGVGVMLLLTAPNLIWQARHFWPTLEFLRNGQIGHKNISLSPLAFLGQQILVLQPASVLVWGAGLYWLLRDPLAKAWRWVGITYVVFLAATLAMHAKDYYVSPIYPMLFAAGGVAWERRFASTGLIARNRAYAFPILETILLVAAAILIPMSIPVLRPKPLIAYAKALHLNHVGNSETDSSGDLPQFYADRFGWREEVDQIERVYNKLSPQEREVAAIYCSNYGEASAVNFLGRGLPIAISGHNNYYLWGPRGASGAVLIQVTGATPEELAKLYDKVEIAGRMDTRYSMPFEHRNIYLLRGRKKDLSEDWAEFKHYF